MSINNFYHRSPDIRARFSSWQCFVGNSFSDSPWNCFNIFNTIWAHEIQAWKLKTCSCTLWRENSQNGLSLQGHAAALYLQAILACSRLSLYNAGKMAWTSNINSRIGGQPSKTISYVNVRRWAILSFSYEGLSKVSYVLTTQPCCKTRCLTLDEGLVNGVATLSQGLNIPTPAFISCQGCSPFITSWTPNRCNIFCYPRVTCYHQFQVG